MPLTVMKPLHAKWLIEMYNVMTSEQGKDVIVSDWEASGICEAIKIGLLELPSLDPFKDISPIVDGSIDFWSFQSSATIFPGCENLNVNSRNEDEDSEWEGNAFDLFNQ